MNSDAPLHSKSDASPRDVDDRHFRDAMGAVLRAIEQYHRCSTEEKLALADDYRQLLDLKTKLETGQVEIVLFGEIDTGKSALINALVGSAVAQVDVRGGWTREVWKVPWMGAGYRVPGLGASQVVLVDTPGINEVEGQDRARMARDAALRADLIIFVTDSDLNDLEYTALVELAARQKPILVALNKVDLYSAADRQRLLQVLRSDRLEGIVGSHDIVSTAADPMEREYLRELPNGQSHLEVRKPSPEVEELKVRILEVLERDGKALIALNAAMYAADRSDRIAAMKVHLRDDRANKVIMSYAATKAVSVALIPPLVDVAAGSAIDATMVATLGKVYGIDLTWTNARVLVKSILQSAGWALLPHAITQVASVFFKSITAHAAAVFTALPQGAAAGYGSYIVGQSAKYYFEHGASWGGEAPKVAVKRILASIDKDSVLARLKDEILRKLNRNPHSSVEPSGG